MALVVTPASASADSYATLAEATTYLSTIWPYAKATWEAFDEAKQEALMRLSAIMFDREVIWNGSRYQIDQAREWPRSGFTVGFNVRSDDEIAGGRTVAIDEVPVELKQAQTLFAAIDLAASDRTQDIAAEALSAQTVKAGGANIKVGRITPKRISDRALFWLRPEWHRGTRARQGSLGSLRIT